MNETIQISDTQLVNICNNKVSYYDLSLLFKKTNFNDQDLSILLQFSLDTLQAIRNEKFQDNEKNLTLEDFQIKILSLFCKSKKEQQAIWKNNEIKFKINKKEAHSDDKWDFWKEALKEILPEVFMKLLILIFTDHE